MIKNAREYQVTKEQAAKLERAIEELTQSDEHPLQVAALSSQLDDLRSELEEYGDLDFALPARPNPATQLIEPARAAVLIDMATRAVAEASPTLVAANDILERCREDLARADAALKTILTSALRVDIDRFVKLAVERRHALRKVALAEVDALRAESDADAQHLLQRARETGKPEDRIVGSRVFFERTLRTLIGGEG